MVSTLLHYFANSLSTLTHVKTPLDNEFTYKSELEHYKSATGKHLVWTTMEASIGQRVRGGENKMRTKRRRQRTTRRTRTRMRNKR